MKRLALILLLLTPATASAQGTFGSGIGPGYAGYAQGYSAAFPGAGEARGVQRITRHPLFMGAGLFGLLHLLVASVNAAELAFFGGFPLFAWAGCRHQDRRKLAEGGEAFRRFHAETGFLPFTAPGALRGLREQPLAVLLGIAAALLLRSYHSAWFSG